MRVAIMCDAFRVGGAERNIVSVAPYIQDAGIDLSIVSLYQRNDDAGMAQELADTGVQRFDMNAKRMIDPAAYQRFTDLVRTEKFDIIHAQDQDTITYAGLANRLLGTSAIMTRHVLFEPSDTLKESVRARLVLLAAKHSFNQIIAVSEAVRQDFSQLANVPIEKIMTMYNGLDLDRFKVLDSKADLRAKLGWDADAPTIIMVAVLRRGKGHELLLESIPRLQEAIPNVQIKLAGDGELADQIREMVKPYGDAVELMGQRSDIPDLLVASDVLTLPSWAEALPTVLIEAGAAGIPAVSTDVGGAKEIVLDGDTGYIVPPGDKSMLADRLIDVLKNPDDAQAMGQRAKDRVTRVFTLEQQAQNLHALYQKVLNS